MSARVCLRTGINSGTAAGPISFRAATAERRTHRSSSASAFASAGIAAFAAGPACASADAAALRVDVSREAIRDLANLLQRLLAQAARTDLAALQRAHAIHSRPPSSESLQLETVEVERLPEHVGGPEKAAAARQRGEEMLADGRVAPLVVAGGQGTRLGFDGPKGVFPIGQVTDRTLFEIQAQKIRGLRRRYGHPLPWCVMTSAATDAATREFFRKAEFFGLPEKDVVFFCQGMVPSMDFEGRMFLEARDRIF